MESSRVSYHRVRHHCPETAAELGSGNAWHGRNSSCRPNPGRSCNGAIAEYNGKSMSNERLLRGQGRATPGGRIGIGFPNFRAPGFPFAIPGFLLEMKP